MKITTSSDWRDAIPFDTPVVAAEVVPGDPARCADCPADAGPHPREQLWAVKHRHPNNSAGFVRFYCAAHRPKVERPAPVPVPAPAQTRSPSARRERRPAPRPAAPERPAVVCSDCFVEVPPTGVCGVCGKPAG